MTESCQGVLGRLFGHYFVEAGGRYTTSNWVYCRRCGKVTSADEKGLQDTWSDVAGESS